MKFLYMLMLAFIPFRLFAWGHAGHQMVAELAMDMLSDATRVKVERVLIGMTPAEAGTWMDDIRDGPKYKYTAPWHFVNINQGGTYTPTPNGDIITALNKAYSELHHIGKLTPEQVKFDVLVLFHLCGDLMQPLHVGYGSDKGGNTYQVQYNGKGTNLHAIRDSRIIEKEHITRSEIRVGQVFGEQKGNFMIWLQQSRDVLPMVYNFQERILDDSYFENSKAVVVKQLTLGVVLLYGCLNKLFSHVSNVPAGPGTYSPQTSQKPANAGKPQVNADTITPNQAGAQIGEQVTVCGMVSGTRLLDNGPTFLNMCGEYPNNPFAAVIMFNKRGNFSYKPEEYLKSKTICVTGVGKDYKGKPEIVVEKEGQVKFK